MTDSKEESKKVSNSKRVSPSRDMVVSSNKSVPTKSSHSKEGILLVSLSLVIMIAAYFIYNGGFGMGSNMLGSTNGDGVCQSTENCLDQPEDCGCVNGEVCSASNKQCIVEEVAPSVDDMPAALSEEDTVLPAESEDMIGVPAESEDITLENCIYNSSEGIIACDTNCQSDPNGNTTLSIVDSDGNMALSRESIVPLKLGTISFSPGKVNFKADQVEVSGSLISFSFSELNSDTSKWVAFMSCKNPLGTAAVTSVLKQ